MFIKYQARTSKYSKYINLSKQTLNIGKQAYEILGSPKRIVIYFDTEKKAIKIVQSENDIDSRKVSEGRHIPAVGLAKVMPLGRYVLTQESIFAYEDEN